MRGVHVVNRWLDWPGRAAPRPRWGRHKYATFRPAVVLHSPRSVLDPVAVGNDFSRRGLVIEDRDLVKRRLEVVLRQTERHQPGHKAARLQEQHASQRRDHVLVPQLQLPYRDQRDVTRHEG